MSPRLQRQTKLEYRDNCGVCGKPLSYGTESVSLRCVFCGKRGNTMIYCPDGHYVCDSCHEHGVLDILRDVINSSKSIDPVEIFETVVSHPSVPMHGPEHHAIVPAVILAAVKNKGYPIPEGAEDKAIARGAIVPGGWCGFYGACGAAVGAGVAVSVLTKATPLTGKERALANEATSLALTRIADGYPRCCKRAGRQALEAAIDFLRDRVGIDLSMRQLTSCRYSERNKECPREGCPYYGDN